MGRVSPGASGCRGRCRRSGRRGSGGRDDGLGGLGGGLDHVIDDAVGLGLVGAQVVVAVGILVHLLDGLAGVFGDDRAEGGAPALDLAGGDGDVGRLAAGTAAGLVDHDAAVGQREAFALGPGGQQHGGHAGGLADAVGDHVALEEVDRVVDGHAAGHHAAGRVDVEVDVLLGILHLQEQELGDDQVGHLVVDRRADEDDPVLEQAGIDVHRPLAAAGVFENDGDVVAHSGTAGTGRECQAVTSAVVTVALETTKSRALSKMIDCWMARRRSRSLVSSLTSFSGVELFIMASR